MDWLAPVTDGFQSIDADAALKEQALKYLKQWLTEPQFAAYVAGHDISQQLPTSAFGFYTAYPYTVQEILADMPPTTTPT